MTGKRLINSRAYTNGLSHGFSWPNYIRYKIEIMPLFMLLSLFFFELIPYQILSNRFYHPFLGKHESTEYNQYIFCILLIITLTYWLDNEQYEMIWRQIPDNMLFQVKDDQIRFYLNYQLNCKH